MAVLVNDMLTGFADLFFHNLHKTKALFFQHILTGTVKVHTCLLYTSMASGNVVVPLDVQLNEETFADNVKRSDLDILFYDWDHYGLVEAVKEKCPRLRACISLQHGKHVPCSDQILKGYTCLLYTSRCV